MIRFSQSVIRIWACVWFLIGLSVLVNLSPFHCNTHVLLSLVLYTLLWSSERLVVAISGMVVIGCIAELVVRSFVFQYVVVDKCRRRKPRILAPQTPNDLIDKWMEDDEQESDIWGG